jgi:hypothetical protein
MINSTFKKKLFDKHIISIFLCAFILFAGKWAFSLYYFDENIDVKILFDTRSDGYMYYPYIKALAGFNFNNSFDIGINELKNISLPFYAILIHSIFLNIFENWSFIILEFICIFFFLLIFYYIFLKFKFSKILSITLSILLFVIPSLVILLNLDQIPYINNLNNIYSLRFPRPLISNLFFYYFIILLINISKKEVFKIKDYFILGAVLSFSFSSFYYFFVIKVISFFLFLLFKYKFDLYSHIKDKIKYYFITIITFIILSLPFLINLYFSEPDYAERLCIIDLTLNRKILLIKHLFLKFIEVKFLSIIILTSILTYFYNRNKITNYKIINISFIIFLSSIAAPFIFITFSPKSCLVYHFNNLIILCGFLCLFFISINFFIFSLKDRFKNKELSYLSISIIVLIGLYNFENYTHYKSNYLDAAYKDRRSNFNLITKEIDRLKIQNKNLSILTFDKELMVWGIMNDVKNIIPLSGQLVPKTHSMIESDLINTFKFLNLDENDFIQFFENKKRGWRYLNNQTQLFFWFRYTANSLKTHNESKNFKKDELSFILNTSPLHVQSLAISITEFERLKLKFINYNVNKPLRPDIVLLNVDNPVLDGAIISKTKYCEIERGNKMKLYILKENLTKCEIK